MNDESNLINKLITRLDAVIGLLIENNRSNEKFLESNYAKILHKIGFTPTEIAHILGKEKATDVAPFLYPKKNKKKNH